MPDLSPASQLAFGLAGGETQALRHKEIDNPHLFLGLCKVEDILFLRRDAIPDFREDEWERAQEEVRDFQEFLEAKGFDCKRARRRLRKILHERQPRKEEFSGHRTPRCREAFDIAERICKGEAEDEIRLKHLLAAVLHQKSSTIDFLFAELSLDKKKLVKDLPEVAAEKPPAGPFRPPEGVEKEKQRGAKARTPYLNKYGRDLTQLAREGKLDPAIGRKEEIKQIAWVLVQKKKNNPILVGDAGVGKSCIVEGLAQKVVDPKAPKQIRDYRIVELSMGTLVAGTKYRGEFEERLDFIIQEASSDPNIVLFIDEIHTMVGAGAGEGALDAGNILKPALARGTIKCIGATATAEYRKYIEKDPALQRRFQIVWVDEPTREEAVQILEHFQ